MAFATSALPLSALAIVVVGTIPGTATKVVVDPAAHRAYFRSGSDSVAVVEGTSVIQLINVSPDGPNPSAVNSALGLVYVRDSQDRLFVIDAATGAVRTVATDLTGDVVVNESTGRAYGRSSLRSTDVMVIDSAGNRSTLVLPNPVCALALNDSTNQLYTVDCTRNAVSASVVDLDRSVITTFPFPGAVQALAVAVNPATNRAYVASSDGPSALLVIDGTAKTSHIVNMGSSGALVAYLAVNPANNRIYAAWGGEVMTLDGASESLVGLRTLDDPLVSLRLDPVSNKVYGVAGQLKLVALDASGNFTSTDLPFYSSGLDIDPQAQRIYVAGDSGAMVDAAASPPPPTSNYQGLWWNPSESGWGVDIAQQGDVWFAAWFTYDDSGDPTWFVMPRGDPTSAGAFSGTLYSTTGPQFSTSPFDPSQVRAQAVGTLSFRFSDASNGVMDATVNGTHVTKSVTRQVFSTVPTCETATFPGVQNFTDLFWAYPPGSESGWGLFLTHQGTTVFSVWFTYANGKATWFVAPNMPMDASSSGRSKTFSGTLYRTSGPPFSAAPWDPSRVTVTPVGTQMLQFDADIPRFYWSVGGASAQPVVVREAFNSQRTFCH